MLLKKKNLHDEYEIRKKKLVNLVNKGFDFPNHFKVNTNIQNINKKYDHYSRQELLKENKLIYLSGRIIKQRIMGKATFIIIQDMIEEIQIYVTEKKITPKIYQEEFKKWDIGDIIGVIGTIFKTHTGELSIYCTKIYLLSKSLRPLPSKFHGLLNQEIRYRKRYLDLLVNKNVTRTFITRSKILIQIRNYMDEKNFVEVETPIMQNIPGGASAKPFVTYHNSLNIKMYLRVSPELYLKRLIIGGLTKIYEISKNFRNEGISYKHNPEFTMMELYIAYANYEDLMNLITDLIKYITKKIYYTYQIKYKKRIIDFNQPFDVFTMKNAILHYNKNIKTNDLLNIQKIKNIAILYNIKVQKKWTIEKIMTKIFEMTTEEKLINPTFITEYPIEISPLAKKNKINKNYADRFELFIGGIEIANGFSELNNPEEQKMRFIKQNQEISSTLNKEKKYDQEYITAMEYGMPPTAGLGIGIDRLIMILTNQSNIRDVILFPTLRPKK
ncbi:lysine--tRNA ligase [Buchnera aphidicola]|uniref:lysine--tRNA ligase n=1 Tax=Buchnera aphidicola TaxID=9 RepID=UPI0031B833CD